MSNDYNVGVRLDFSNDRGSLMALKRAVSEQEQVVRFFMRRDEMNAEVHLVDGDTASVRYSPITINANRTLKCLWDLLYSDPPVSLLP